MDDDRRRRVLSGIIIAVLIPVAATGLLGLGAVVATHEIAEIAVIINALRVRRGISAHTTHEHPASATTTRQAVHA